MWGPSCTEHVTHSAGRESSGSQVGGREISLNMLEGEVVYRHADRLYTLTPGDSLFFDADAARAGGAGEAAGKIPFGDFLRARRE
jgi:glyoxylate utilization-related uncharacterized protein